MKTEPQKEHQWLQKLVGEWTCEAEMEVKPDEPQPKTEWSESVRSLGDLWIVAEGNGEMPGGGAATTIMTLGYNPRTKRYVGTWVGSMMSELWVYEGELDSSERVLPLETEGPSMAGDGKTVRYQDVIEIIDDDHRTLTSQTLGDDGKWQLFMTTHYRRKS